LDPLGDAIVTAVPIALAEKVCTPDQMSERLDLMRMLMGQRLRAIQNRVGVNQSLSHIDPMKPNM